MGEHFKLTCGGCGKVEDIEYDHGVCELRKLMDGIEDDVKVLREAKKTIESSRIAVRDFYNLIITELKKQNQLIKHYHTDPSVLENIIESCRTFMKRCNNCNFKKTGSASEMLIITHCPKCSRELGDLLEIIKPGGVPAGD